MKSYEAVRQWVRRSGSKLGGYFEAGEARVAVIDEALIKVGSEIRREID